MATIIKLWPFSDASVHEIGHLAFPCDTEALGFQRPDRDLNDISYGIGEKLPISLAVDFNGNLPITFGSLLGLDAVQRAVFFGHAW